MEGLDSCNDLAKQRGEPTEDLISITLVDENPKHTVKIGSNLHQVIKDQLTLFFIEIYRCLWMDSNRYVGHDPMIMMHRLNVDLKF